MSTAAAALTVLAVLLVGVPAAYWQIWRAAAHESTKARIVRETHERARAAALSDPVTLTAADQVANDIGGHLVGYLLDNPQLAAGFERLDRAMREQQKGEQL